MENFVSVLTRLWLETNVSLPYTKLKALKSIIILIPNVEGVRDILNPPPPFYIAVHEIVRYILQFYELTNAYILN